jgi:protein required for attachment to host cells
MSAYWIVIADSSRAQLFAAERDLEQLVPLHSLVHPASRSPARELVSSDRGAVWNSTTGVRSRYERHTDPHRATVDTFARELAVLLRGGRVARSYDQLVLVAPPAFLGFLREHLDADTARLVSTSISRDWANVAESELPERLREALAEA